MRGVVGFISLNVRTESGGEVNDLKFLLNQNFLLSHTVRDSIFLSKFLSKFSLVLMMNQNVGKRGRSPPVRTSTAAHTLRSSSRGRHSNPYYSVAGPSSTNRRPSTSVRPITAAPGGSQAPSYGLVRKESMRPRYPNYLPELKARRAVMARRSESRPGPSSPDLMDEVNASILRQILTLNDRPAFLASSAQTTLENEAGHELHIPPERVTRHYPRMVLSLYRSPASKVRSWDTGSPLVQFEGFRGREGAGAGASQLPSPDSSHNVMLSTRGRRKRASSQPNQ